MLTSTFVLLFLDSILQFACAVPISSQTTSANTANTTQLKTWWHSTGEINTNTTVQNGNVRQSHLYSLQVGTTGNRSTASQYYDSFAYGTIPGNGMTTSVDGYGETQAWTQFLYGADASVKITRSGKSASPVVIRPTNLNFTVITNGSDVYVQVPYNSHGYRFSVEFQDDLRTMSPSTSQHPWNALLVFASPLEDLSLVPQANESAIIVPQGRVTGLDTTTKSTVIFNPGVYWFTGQDHMKLSSSVTWVYFHPGAYVKGAVEFTSGASTVKATGHGVLAGEQYVWYADPNNSYQTSDNSNNNGLRMWKGNCPQSAHQTFVLKGVTINAPPFNTMDWVGDVTQVSVMATDYKQVGSFYGQTDGLEMYPGSLVQDVFYHTNDDTIKTYYSNVVAKNMVIWKMGVAPTVQFGWASRTLANITIDSISIIHQAYGSADSNPGVIGADNSYAYTSTGISSNHHTADTSNLMQNVTWSNFRAEGPSACLFRVNALQNLKNILIQNAWIENFAPSSLQTTKSLLPVFYDAESGAQVDVTNFMIQDFYVGNTKITASNAVSVGRMGIDPAYESSAVYM